MIPIIINPKVLRVAGPVPALVYAILAASDTGDGIELAYSQIADAAYISVSSARRAVATLRQVLTVAVDAVDVVIVDADGVDVAKAPSA